MTFTKNVILFFFFIIVSQFSIAQNYKNYTIEDGLPSNHVYRISQDNLGFIWIITDKGMVKFDGKEFKLFTTQTGMPINDIWNIRITPDNKVWYFSKSTELGYIENDSIHTFTSKTENEVLSPRSIGQSNNSLFFQSGNFSYELKNNHFEKTNLLRSRDSVYRSNIIGDSLISYFEKSNDLDLITFRKKNDELVWEVPFSPQFDFNFTNYGQLNDSLYYFLSNKDILFYNFKAHTRNIVKYKDQLNVDLVNISRLHDINNQIQVTGEHFVAYLSEDYNLVNIKRLSRELDTHFSFIDKSGNIWSASFSKGVFFHPVEKFNTNSYFVNDKVQHLKLIDDQIYTTIYKKGLFIYNPKTNSFDLKKKNEHFAYEFKKFDSLNFKIYSTEKELFTFKHNKFSVIDNHYSFRETNVLGRKFEFHNGFLYANNHEGINKFNPDGIKFIEQHKSLAINNLVSFQGKLMLGSSSGLKQLVNNVIVDIGDVELFKLPIIVVKKLNNSTLLVGTDGFGVYTFNGINANWLKVTEGLSVEDIFVESENKFWIATQKGVYKLTEKGKTYGVEDSYFKSDGLLTDKVNSIVVKDSLLYAGTDIGISSFNYNKSYNNQNHNIYIKNVLLGNEKLQPDNVSVKFKKDNNIQFNFGFIDFQNQDNITTSYRLVPLQNQWTTINTNQINLNNLSPDNYTLEIKAVSHDKKEEIKQISIEIKPNFWQQPWFQILAIILGVLLVVYTVYFLIKKSQKKHHQKLLFEKNLAEIQLKALRSQMNPHFVFNSLAAIQYYINNNDFESSEAYLLKFSKLVRQFFEQAKENEIFISDEINLLRSYLEIEKLRFKNKLNFNFYIDKKLNVDKIKIPTLLLQPIVENAVNHGVFNKMDAGTIEIKFIYIDELTYNVEIVDDGVGIKNTIQSKKRGVKSSSVLKDRVYFLNQSGEWNIEYTTTEAFPELKEPGNISIFKIKKIIK